MNTKKIAPKALQQKASEGGAPQLYVVPCPDPLYIGQQLRGLARLVFHASNDSDNAEPIDQEAAFFISATLEQMALALGAR
jgi:hypothetical protein